MAYIKYISIVFGWVLTKSVQLEVKLKGISIYQNSVTYVIVHYIEDNQQLFGMH